MSIQDSGMTADSYSDFEIQHIRDDLAYLDSADAGPDTAITDIQTFSVTERGLDNDELAELAYLRADLAIYSNSVGDQTTRNVFKGYADFGVNLSGDEFLNTDVNVDGLDADASGTDDFNRLFRDTDEAGQFYSEELHCDIGHRDTGNSVSAGATIDRVQVVVPFREQFGSGPFLDATDDLTQRLRLDVDNAIDSARLTSRLALAYDVDVIEGGRAAFGRP